MIGRLSPRRRRTAAAAIGAEPPAAGPDRADGDAPELAAGDGAASAATTVHLDPSLPAGVASAPGATSDAPGFRSRGRLRRRMRYLRRVRELAFRDVGGLVFDLHRFGRDGRELVQGKLEALAGVDEELRTLERVLGERREVVVLHEPGLAACPRCGALHGSEARFCSACGLDLAGPRPAHGSQAPADGADPSQAPSPTPPSQ